MTCLFKTLWAMTLQGWFLKEITSDGIKFWFESEVVVSHCVATGCLLLVPAKNMHKIKHLLVCYQGKCFC